LLGGSLEIQSAPDQGTKIHTQFDLENLPHAG
jgi:signal transduction histidine kinase